MILAVDVHYRDNFAKTVCVLFDWQEDKPLKMITDNKLEVAPYEPGSFYKRELPCILQAFQKVDLSLVETIIVDGHVYVNNDKKYGLGAYLWEALHEEIPIIGVAKRSFIHTEKVSKELYSASSNNPLYVSAIGIPIEEAYQKVSSLHGDYRIPTILKILDQETKS